MTKITISQLIWDAWNIEHIKKHRFTKEEVEFAIGRIYAHRQGYSKRVFLIGRAGKRILSVLVKQQEDNRYYVVTVRDADRKERKLLYKNEENKNTSI